MPNAIQIAVSAAVVALVACAAASRASAQSIRGAVLTKNEPHHHVAYTDGTMRVLRVHVAPHDSTLLHEHAPDYFWIALGASEVVNARLGAPDAVIKSADLSVHYTPGKFAHVARNPGSTAFDNITIELLRPQSDVRNTCEPALGGKPMDCPAASTPVPGSSGATEHSAFTTAQLRVSVITLEPGAVWRPRAGSERWVIALDTLDTKGGLKLAGPARWVGGVLRSSSARTAVTNGSAHVVRVLAAERR